MSLFTKRQNITLAKEEINKISEAIRSIATSNINNSSCNKEDATGDVVRHSIDVGAVNEIFSYMDFDTFADDVKKALDTINLSERDFYKRSGIGRRIYWNIANNKDYKPSKETAIACVLGLHLNSADAELLLKKAGFALSNCDIFDVAIAYCIEHEIYNILDVNAILDELEIDKQLRTE